MAIDNPWASIFGVDGGSSNNGQPTIGVAVNCDNHAIYNERTRWTIIDGSNSVDGSNRAGDGGGDDDNHRMEKGKRKGDLLFAKQKG